jgi:hypothetical protein
MHFGMKNYLKSNRNHTVKLVLNRLHSYQFNLLNICFFNFHQFGYNFLIYSVVVEQLFHKLLDQFSDFIRILRRN